MSTLDINKPFRLTLSFWVTYGVLALPVLWFTRPWLWDLPVYSRAAAVFFFPFAATIITYCPFVFVRAVFFGDSSQRRGYQAFFFSMVTVVALLFVVWWHKGFGRMPGYSAFAAVFIGNIMAAIFFPRTPT
jgi:hypothetical protein